MPFPYALLLVNSVLLLILGVLLLIMRAAAREGAKRRLTIEEDIELGKRLNAKIYAIVRAAKWYRELIENYTPRTPSEGVRFYHLKLRLDELQAIIDNHKASGKDSTAVV